MKGRISSFQSMGAADGPGIRFVVFMQGCPLRCVYCHNPETWDPSGGEEWEVEQIVEKVLRYRSYFGTKGGITVSGGEPLLQWEFVAELFEQLKEKGIHTALDTSGTGTIDGWEKVLSVTDLVLCDLKFSQAEEYHRFCGGNQKQVLDFIGFAEKMDVPMWIRHVVVPKLTDSITSIRKITELSLIHQNLEKIQLLPFRKLCAAKYEALCIPFNCDEFQECSEGRITEIKADLIKHFLLDVCKLP